MHNAGLNVLKYRTQKIAKNSPSAHHRTTLSGYSYATKACIDNRKKLLNSNIFSTCPNNMVNFSPLTTTEIGWRVWGTPANFKGFRVLASLLHRRRWTEINQTLHDVWRFPGLIHYIYTCWISYLLTEFWYVQNSLCVQVLRSPILAALLHGTRAVGANQTLWRGTRNGTTELSLLLISIEGATYIPKAAITLGIGLHSLFYPSARAQPTPVDRFWRSIRHMTCFASKEVP